MKEKDKPTRILKPKKEPVMIKCPGSCGQMIRSDHGHACRVRQENSRRSVLEVDERSELVPAEPKIGIYFTEKDLKKRMDLMFIHMLEGLSKLLAHSGDFECKGYGGIDPKEALFHCRACICNGIRNHVDQAIERLEERSRE